MIVSIDNWVFDNKKIGFLEKINENRIQIFLTTSRSLTVDVSMDTFFSSSFLVKKDFIKWKNLYFYAKNVDMIYPRSRRGDMPCIYTGNAGRYVDLSEKEYTRLVTAVKKAQNWTVALRR